MKRAFTLIELLLYMGIVSVVMTTLVLYAWNVIQTGARNSRQEEVTAAARQFSERIKYEIRNSSGIDTANSDFINDPGKLSLNSTLSSNNPTIILSESNRGAIKTGTDAIDYLTPSNTLISSLKFYNYSSADNKTKQIVFGFTVRSTIPSQGGGYESMTLESSAEVRSNQ